jgi:hypothetical protein
MDAATSNPLPNRRPDRMWGGPGVGFECTICRTPVKRDEVEFELEFVRDGVDPGLDKYHVHIRCFTAWERNLESSRGARPWAAAP